MVRSDRLADIRCVGGIQSGGKTRVARVQARRLRTRWLKWGFFGFRSVLRLWVMPIPIEF